MYVYVYSYIIAVGSRKCMHMIGWCLYLTTNAMTVYFNDSALIVSPVE